jgi:hypothetical protein
MFFGSGRTIKRTTLWTKQIRDNIRILYSDRGASSCTEDADDVFTEAECLALCAMLTLGCQLNCRHVCCALPLVCTCQHTGQRFFVSLMASFYTAV